MSTIDSSGGPSSSLPIKNPFASFPIEKFEIEVGSRGKEDKDSINVTLTSKSGILTLRIDKPSWDEVPHVVWPDEHEMAWADQHHSRTFLGGPKVVENKWKEAIRTAIEKQMPGINEKILNHLTDEIFENTPFYQKAQDLTAKFLNVHPRTSPPVPNLSGHIETSSAQRKMANYSSGDSTAPKSRQTQKAADIFDRFTDSSVKDLEYGKPFLGQKVRSKLKASMVPTELPQWSDGLVKRAAKDIATGRDLPKARMVKARQSLLSFAINPKVELDPSKLKDIRTKVEGKLNIKKENEIKTKIEEKTKLEVEKQVRQTLLKEVGQAKLEKVIQKNPKRVQEIRAQIEKTFQLHPSTIKEIRSDVEKEYQKKLPALIEKEVRAQKQKAIRQNYKAILNEVPAAKLTKTETLKRKLLKFFGKPVKMNIHKETAKMENLIAQTLLTIEKINSREKTASHLSPSSQLHEIRTEDFDLREALEDQMRKYSSQVSHDELAPKFVEILGDCLTIMDIAIKKTISPKLTADIVAKTFPGFKEYCTRIQAEPKTPTKSVSIAGREIVIPRTVEELRTEEAPSVRFAQPAGFEEPIPGLGLEPQRQLREGQPVIRPILAQYGDREVIVPEDILLRGSMRLSSFEEILGRFHKKISDCTTYKDMYKLQIDQNRLSDEIAKTKKEINNEIKEQLAKEGINFNPDLQETKFTQMFAYIGVILNAQIKDLEKAIRTKLIANNAAVKNDGKGDCLFLSLSLATDSSPALQLNSKALETRAKKVRNDIASHMLQNKKEYFPIVEARIAKDNLKADKLFIHIQTDPRINTEFRTQNKRNMDDFDCYCIWINQQGQWGADPEVRAFSDMIKRPILSLGLVQGYVSVIPATNPGLFLQGAAIEPLILLNSGNVGGAGTHFEAILHQDKIVSPSRPLVAEPKSILRKPGSKIRKKKVTFNLPEQGRKRDVDVS